MTQPARPDLPIGVSEITCNCDVHRPQCEREFRGARSGVYPKRCSRDVTVAPIEKVMQATSERHGDQKARIGRAET